MNAMTQVPTPIRIVDATEMDTYDARELIRDGESQARIVLGDQTYYLRITRAGKLILTK